MADIPEHWDWNDDEAHDAQAEYLDQAQRILTEAESKLDDLACSDAAHKLLAGNAYRAIKVFLDNVKVDFEEEGLTIYAFQDELTQIKLPWETVFDSSLWIEPHNHHVVGWVKESICKVLDETQAKWKAQHEVDEKEFQERKLARESSND